MDSGQMRGAIAEAAQMRRAGSLLAAEAMRSFTEAQRLEQMNRQQGNNIRAGLLAGAEMNWTLAPVVRDTRDAIAAQWGITPRSAYSFYLDEPLQRRTLTAVDTGAALELVGVADTARVQEQRDTASAILGLMTVVTGRGANQMIGRLETLPTTAVLASETTNATDETPVAGQSILTPRNITAFSRWSRKFALQSEAGAAAVARLHAAAVKNKLLQQILAGSGSNGEIEGLLNISAVPTTDGGTLTWAMVADTIADVEANSSGQGLTWVVSASAAEIMRQRAGVSNVSAVMQNNTIGGYPVYITGCMSSAIAIFGAWADLYVHQWSPVEIATDPYGVNSANFQTGTVSVRAWLTADAAPLLNGSFSTIHSIT